MDQRERHFPFVKILAESFSLKVLFSDQLGPIVLPNFGTTYLSCIQILIIISDLEVASHECDKLAQAKLATISLNNMSNEPFSSGILTYFQYCGASWF